MGWKIFRRCLKVTAFLYWFIYAIRVFVEWYFMNPFDWIIKMPTYKSELRGIILFMFFCYWLFLGVIVSAVTLEEEADKKSKL